MEIRKNDELWKSRVDTIGVNKYGSKMIAIECNGSYDILVKFQETNEKINTTWQRFTKGDVRSKYDRTCYGVGYSGEGKYKAEENDKITDQYAAWTEMLRRCYDEKNMKRNITYLGCRVIDEWHNFQNFAKWYDHNYYQVNEERMHLDKDILIKGNKIYSPETCVFVPQRINSLFLKSNARRGSFPIGVYKEKRNNKFVAQCHNGNNKTVHIGTYGTADEAFNSYKIYKEKLIKQIAEDYKDKIPQKLYESMVTYKVEITD